MTKTIAAEATELFDQFLETLEDDPIPLLEVNCRLDVWTREVVPVTHPKRDLLIDAIYERYDEHCS